jgi:DNA-binding HxlR family transcriptional regulator
MTYDRAILQALQSGPKRASEIARSFGLQSGVSIAYSLCFLELHGRIEKVSVKNHTILWGLRY